MDSVKEGIRRSLAELLATSGKRNVDLAYACGVGKSAVSNWLSGKSSIDVERIPAICDFFGITADEFFGRSEAMRPGLDLGEDETELLRLYSEMDAVQKGTILTIARQFSVANVKNQGDAEGALELGAMDAVRK